MTHKNITNASPGIIEIKYLFIYLNYFKIFLNYVLTYTIGTFEKKFLADAIKIRVNNTRQRILFPKHKPNLKSSEPDENYGLTEPLINDISEEDIKKKEIAFIKSQKPIEVNIYTSKIMYYKKHSFIFLINPYIFFIHARIYLYITIHCV